MPEERTDAEPEEPLRAYAEFYPEIVRAGSLRHALQAAADRAGHARTIGLMPQPGRRHVVACARSGDRSSFLGSGGPSEADGPGDAVSVRWRRLRASAAAPPYASLYELVEAAFAEPRLRALSPRTSHDRLRFSRRATAPLRTDLPMVRATGNGRYRVRTCEGLLHHTTGTAETIALILDHLPGDDRPLST
ncbi:DUF6193 family natural product biosynthesis protein [Streptomyces sp. NPDC048357]|uniref:DUF6193 family natural product biosynthesis protein n=1 Tax=Streptomyces sp. NPDC048357 TaxID=3154719 RepID=UPI0034228411